MLREAVADEYILTPIQAQGLPTLAELATRFPGLTAEQVTDIQDAYQWENARLEKCIRGNSLLEWAQRITMLERADREASNAEIGV